MHRRDFLRYGAIAALAPVSDSVPVGRRVRPPGELWDLTAVSATTALREGDISAEAYASALLARCERFVAFNAFISLDRVRVLENARRADLHRRSGAALGPLHGLPLPVKDSINTAELPTSSGTAALRDFRPTVNAPVLQALVSAGAIVLGKTNLHELSLGVTSNNSTFGPCRNPYDASRISGGSSGGSAVAVALRMAPLAVGEDTTCSIRVPAALCGIAGLRPTTGRYPQAGVMPISPRFDSVGAMARSVEDLLLFDSVQRPGAPVAPPRELRAVRFGAPPAYWESLDPEVERVAQEALYRLRADGAEVVSVDVPEVVKSDLATVIDILSYEVTTNEANFLRNQAAGVSFEQMLTKMSAALRSRFEREFIAGGVDSVPESRYRVALRQLEVICEAMRQHFRDNELTALVFPPTLTPALPIGVEGAVTIGSSESTVRTAMLRNTVHASCVGMPGLVLPAGLTRGGLPVGIEFDMLPGDDRALLSMGLRLERAIGSIAPPRDARFAAMPAN